MQKIVEVFLAQQEAKKREQALEKRREHLLALGLYQVEEVADDDNGSCEFQDGKRVRFHPVELTDEEYAAVCAAAPEEKADVRSSKWPVPPVCKILYVLAICVYVVGLVQGFSMFGQLSDMFSYGAGLYSVTAVVMVWLAYAVGGTLLLAVSELLRLLKKRCGEE